MPHPQAEDLLTFIDASPSPFHAVQTSVERLQAAGFTCRQENEQWAVSPGERFYCVRDGGSLIAFVVGNEAPEQTGFRLVGAHTDSPTLRVKPNPDVQRHGYSQVAVEVYGGALYHTWLDRDLSLAGRVWLSEDGGSPSAHLVDLKAPLLRIPSLAIHLMRTVNSEGLKLNAQDHLSPVLGLARPDTAGLAAHLAEQLHANPDRVLSWDLSTYDVQPSRFGGVDEAFIFAPRIDNLAGCHGAIESLIASGSASATTRVVVLYDHEECGSQSARGAKSNLVEMSLRRVLAAHGPYSEDRFARALSRSLMVSSDMAHGVHPNYPNVHEPEHRPVLGKGPVIKSHSNQAYGTDGEGWALFEQLAGRAGVATQRFVSRSDLGCGSTVGPITAARLGIRTLDVGCPMLSMHSSREMAATDDVAPMLALLEAFLKHEVA